jgi:signal transduction histidine kinase
MLSGPDSLFTWLLILSVVCLSYLVLLIWQRRKAAGARYLLAVMLGSIIWTLFYILEVRTNSFSLKLLWAKAKYLGIVVTPAAWFLFVLEYTGARKFVWHHNLSSLSVVPALTLLMVATNSWHHLFWNAPTIQGCGDFQYLQVDHTFFFWLHTVYSNLLLIGSLVILIRTLLHSHPFYRSQILIMIFALLFPWIGHALYLIGVTSCMLRDPTPFAFLLTGVVVTVGNLRFRWLDLVPVARAVVLETMQDAVIVVDSKERLVDLNPAAASTIRGDPQGMIGTPISDVLPNWSELRALCLEESHCPMELSLETGTEARVYEVRISSLDHKRSGGLQAGYVVILHDITEYTRAADEREQLIQDLNAFAYTVAHDLKAPVGTLMTAANVIQDEYDTLPPEQFKVLADVIAQGANKTVNIIDEMLALAGLQKGVEVTFRPLDMNFITKEALARMQQDIQTSGADVIVPEKWPKAVGHAPWVEEVWVNYVSNAVKYGGTPPCIELGADPPTNGEVRFWIQDNGPGVGDIDAELLFEPFTRFAKIPVPGHGLGLSIVKRIVERLKGEVGVDVNVEQGSRFFFTLPSGNGSYGDEVES